VGKADSDMNEASYTDATRNGVRFSNMNHAIRHLGIPSVSVAMGIMSDIRMPVNLTFVGRAYSDNALLSYAYAYEQASHNRQPPPRTPALADETFEYRPGALTPPARRRDKSPPKVSIGGDAKIVDSPPGRVVRVSGDASDAGGLADVRVYVNGHKVSVIGATHWRADIPLGDFADWRTADPARVGVIVLARDRAGNAGAQLREMDLTKLLGSRSK